MSVLPIGQAFPRFLLDVAERTEGLRKHIGQKTWIFDDTFDVIKQKRQAKQKNPARHKELKTRVQRCLRADRQRQLDEMCDDLKACCLYGVVSWTGFYHITNVIRICRCCQLDRFSPCFQCNQDLQVLR